MNYFDPKLLENARIVRSAKQPDAFELRQVNGHDLTLIYRRSLSDWRARVSVTAVFTDEFGEQTLRIHDADLKQPVHEDPAFKFWAAAQNAEMESYDKVRQTNYEKVTAMLARKKPTRKKRT